MSKNNIPSGILIDDETMILSFYSEALADNGIKLQTFQVPSEAISFLKATDLELDFIICDFDMPDINGYELFEMLPERFKQSTVCILHSGSVPFVKKPLNIKYFSSLSKPIMMEDLVTHIKNLVANAKSAQKNFDHGVDKGLLDKKS